MPRDINLYLEAILTAIQRIETYTQGLDFDTFSSSPIHVDAVLHNLQIIGEAVKQLPENLRLQDPEIQWRKVAGLRDIVTHQYFSVSLEIVWDVLQNHLPAFGNRITALLDNLDRPDQT